MIADLMCCGGYVILILQGESAAVLNSLEAVRTCLRQPEGCTVVPGLTSDEYGFTLLVSAAAGLVAGATVRIEPQGFIQRRFVWALIFSPLWGTLFFNLALGPVRVRTDDLAPVLGNTAAFLAAALLLWLGPELLGGQQKRAE